ncbi:MAG: SRPBCC family protein [Acidobacteria bacterium]|nr:SRPBCC family protein [Acidobacteriota bacterium]
MPVLFETVQHLAVPLKEVWSFFADPNNLKRLMPPSMNVHLVSEPPHMMERGVVMTVGVRVFGIPSSWVVEIEAWHPPHGFTDVQSGGLFSYWKHQHQFHEVDGVTEIKDTIRFQLPWLLRLFHPIVVWQMKRLFAYRQAALRSIFNAS